MTARPTVAGSWITPVPMPVHLEDFELAEVLAAVDLAYEAAWHLADVGRIDFSPFEPLVRALRILRQLRDERKAAAEGRAA